MAEAEGAEGSTVALATSKSTPPQVAYHTNVRCRRGHGCTCGVGPVIVGPMYRVGEVCVCEGAASEEEKKAHSAVKPPICEGWSSPPCLTIWDLRGWKAADIQGLRGPDGTLDLMCAILCGVDLCGAQLQRANFGAAQLQGANLVGAQLQGANLRIANLQGANLCGADLRGADLGEATQLQGADLSHADLTVLPKGFLLPKKGSAGETETTKENQPTNLSGANLSLLPKGSEYLVGWTRVPPHIKVSDSARPTNLTSAKVSGASFNDADLSGADFTSATIDLATLTDATFAPLQPPERPASGALHGAWRRKALVGSMAHAAMAAGDDDDDDDSDGGSDDDDDEEESPVEAEMEKSLDASMDQLAAASQGFMHTVDGMVGKVEALLKSSLLKSCKGTGRNSSVSVLDADSLLAELLCKKLETANDKQAAIFETLSTHVISPLFEHHLPAVLDEALSKLPPPTNEAGAAGHPLLEQLLETFTERALGAGKSCTPEAPVAHREQVCGGSLLHHRGPGRGWRVPLKASILAQERGAWPSSGRGAGAGATHEGARHLPCAGALAGAPYFPRGAGAPPTTQEPPVIMSPKRSLSDVHCLGVCTSNCTRRLQVSDVILSCAMAPLKRAGKSVQRMAGRLNKLEGAIHPKALGPWATEAAIKAHAESQRFVKKFGLVGGEKGGLRSRLAQDDADGRDAVRGERRWL